MKKRGLTLLLAAVMLGLLTTPAYADMGPKPSVVLEIEGIEEEYYVTLLSETESTGPWSKGNEYQDWYGERNAWEAFDSYRDEDGFYFIGCYASCSGRDSFAWTYYPPAVFKILIYFPRDDRMVVSEGVYERYAFDSYYTVNAANLDGLTVLEGGIEVSSAYDYKWELISLLCRIVATLLVELGIALLFGFRARKQLTAICVVNLATQLVLNVLLNLINYKYGAAAFILNYAWMELAVFVIEGACFAKLLPKYAASPERRTRPWLYALTANAVSFAVGMLIARWIPGIF